MEVKGKLVGGGFSPPVKSQGGRHVVRLGDSPVIHGATLSAFAFFFMLVFENVNRTRWVGVQPSVIRAGRAGREGSPE